MFSLLRNYKAMLMMCVANTLNENRMHQADTNDDGVLSVSEYNSLSDADKRKMIADLKRSKIDKSKYGHDNMWDYFLDQKRLRFAQKEQAQATVRKTASDAQDSTSRDVQQAYSGVLSPNKLRSAVGYYQRGKVSQPEAKALIRVMQANKLKYENTWESFAENIATLQKRNRLSVDGKAGPNTRSVLLSGAKEVAQTSRRRSPERSGKVRLKMPDTNNKPQVRGVQKYLRDRGYTNVSGRNAGKLISVDGVWGKNTQAAFNAFNGGNQAVSGTVNQEKRNWFEKLLGIGNRKQTMAKIDAYINASKKDLTDLSTEITNAKKSGDRAIIQKVFNKAIAAVKPYLPANIYNAMAKARNQSRQEEVLDYIENATMGTASSARSARGETGAESYYANPEAVAKKALGVLRSNGFGFTGTIDTILKRLRPSMKGNLPSRTISDRVYFSVRTQGSNQQLSPFTVAIEQLQVAGSYTWEIHESQNDILRFIDNMSDNQLRIIDRKVKNNRGKLTKARLKKLVASGEVELDAKMFLAENCSNISFVLDIKDNTRAAKEDKDRDDKTDKPTTQPGEDATTSPGESTTGGNDDTSEVSDGDTEGAGGGQVSNDNLAGF